MKILVFDTETGGLNAYDNDILQLSYQIVDGETFDTIREVNHYFPWPDDKSRVQLGAIQVNGLTEEYLSTQVLSSRYEALTDFVDDLSMCDLCVAHNGEFDMGFINATARREGVRCPEWPAMVDTMKSTVDICCIPHKRGWGYKWPKLIELAECLCIKTDDINLHDSSADVELTKRCFIYLLEHRMISCQPTLS